MAINNRFELYKIRREIRRNGTELKFLRSEQNDFGEPIGEFVEVASIKGLYYEHSAHILDAYIVLMGAEAASTRTKKTPVLLCPWEDIFEPVEEPVDPEPEEPVVPGDGVDGEEVPDVPVDGETVEEPAPEESPEAPKKCKIQIGDCVMINGHESHVTGIYNVMEWDLICHISFEEVDYGSQGILPGGQKPDKSPP